MSYNLWTSERFFPMIPYFDMIPDIQYPFDIVLLIFLIILLTLGVFIGRQKVFILLFGMLIFFLLQDQMRWQPWVYLYILILLPFLKKDVNNVSKELINYFQIILVGMYVWSGLQKLNPNFIEFTFIDMLTRLLNIEDTATINNISKLGYSIPIAEILIGLCLAIPKFRNAGVYFALLTHIFILIYLSPLGINYNPIVYPWNIAMMIIVFLTFYEYNQRLILWQKRKIKLQILNLLVIIMIWILPTLNMFDKWDHYLSFSLYSGKPNDFYIAVEENELKKMAKRYDPYFVKIEGMIGGEIIDVNKWSMEELNVPIYPQTRVFKKLGKSFCNLGIADDKLIFIEYEKPLSKMKFSSFQCKDL